MANVQVARVGGKREEERGGGEKERRGKRSGKGEEERERRRGRRGRGRRRRWRRVSKLKGHAVCQSVSDVPGGLWWKPDHHLPYLSSR